MGEKVNNFKNQIVEKKSRGIYLLPNLFTLAALFAGFYAVVSAMRDHFSTAAIAIFIAMILDGLDGRVARMTRSQSAFGAQFDSLSDMVSFGVAPALVLYTWCLSGVGKPGWLAAFIYAVCTALRLARFNIQEVHDKRYFQGLATPAAAGLVASLVWVGDKYGIDPHTIAIPMSILAIFLGMLKVSSVRYRSFKDLNIRGRVPFMVILLVVMVYVLIIIDPPDVFLGVFALYVLSGPLGFIWQWIRKRRLPKPDKKDTEEPNSD